MTLRTNVFKYLEIQAPPPQVPSNSIYDYRTCGYACHGHRENLGDGPSSGADLEVLQGRRERSYQIKGMSTETFPTPRNQNVLIVVTQIY